MTDKTETDIGPRYLLRGIPNDSDGRAFIKQLRSYLNRDRWTIRLRGNAPAKDGKVYPYGVPTGQASTLRLYADDTALASVQATDYAYRQTMARLDTARAELAAVERNIALAGQLTDTVYRVTCETGTVGYPEHDVDAWQYVFTDLATAEQAIYDAAGEDSLHRVPDLCAHTSDGRYTLTYTSDDRDSGHSELTRYHITKLVIRYSSPIWSTML